MKPVACDRAQLILGVLAAQGVCVKPVVRDLVSRFGPLAMVSRWMPFTDTHYYKSEMGGPLLRRALAFERPVDQGDLVEIKEITNQLEERFSCDGARRVNLDPGLLLPSRFVLATAKDCAHRVYLSRGFYADLTLIYKGGAFKALPWTYPDYKSGPMYDFLTDARRRFLRRGARRERVAFCHQYYK